MIGQGDRLGSLQVGISRHYRILVLFRQGHKGVHEGGKQFLDFGNFIFQIEPDVHRHLVVTAAGSMKLFAGFTDALGKDRFDIHMDIFRFNGEFHLTGVNVGFDFFQGFDNQLRVHLGNDSLASQHGRVSDASFNIVFVQPLVEFDRGVELVSGRSRRL